MPAYDPFDEPTQAVPHVAPVPRAPSPVRRFAPWVAFGVVAAAVVAGTTAWSTTLRGSDEPLLAQAAVPSLARPAPLADIPTVSSEASTPTDVALAPPPVVLTGSAPAVSPSRTAKRDTAGRGQSPGSSAAVAPPSPSAAGRAPSSSAERPRSSEPQPRPREEVVACETPVSADCVGVSGSGPTGPVPGPGRS